MTSDGYTEKYAMRSTNTSCRLKDTWRLCTLCSKLENVSNISVARRDQAWLQYKLSDEELRNGCKLGFDSYADTCCAGRHARVESFVEGKTVSASGFSSTMPVIENLPLANVLYAYDTQDGETFILRVNNAIYLGDQMEDSLLCPNQCRENGVLIDTRPAIYCKSETAATMECPERDIRIPIRHHGPLPFIPVRRPTMNETMTCNYIDITSEAEWDPYGPQSPTHSGISKVAPSGPLAQGEVSDELDYISKLFMGRDLESILSKKRLIVEVTTSDRMPDYRSIEAVSAHRKNMLSPEDLSKLWRIGLKAARRTLKATSHRCIRTAGNLTRHFKTDKAHLRYKRLATREGSFYVDTLFSKVKSIRGYTCGNLYTTPLGFKKFFPMEGKTGQECFGSLQTLVHLVGIPPTLHSDNAPEFVQGDFRKRCRKYDIQQTTTEPHSPWQNRAESAIREVKSYASKVMERNQVPVRLWCFAYEYAAEILSLVVPGSFQLQNRTPYESVMHYTPDISEYVNFHFYQWCYYWDETDKEKKLGRWLGVAHQVGQSMCYWVLIENGHFIARSTVIPIPDDDASSTSLKERMERFTTAVHDVIGNHHRAVIRGESINEDDIYYDAFFEKGTEMEGLTYPYDMELSDIPLSEQDDQHMRDLDEYIRAKVLLPNREGIEVLCTVKGRKRNADGVTIGEYHQNPILDTRIFQVEHPDGRVEEYATNVIAESLLGNVDDQGFDVGWIDDILDHRKRDTALSASEGYVITGTKRKPVITTKGWDLQVRWRDGSVDWLPLSQVKESIPIELAEYAVARKIDKEPAFNWWVNKTLRKRDRIIRKIGARKSRKPNMKFGIEIPRNVEEAQTLDAKNGNSYWQDAIKKEYNNVKIAFRLLEDGEKPPPAYTEITCHLIFEVKFDLRRKARYVAGGHLTEPPSTMTYSSVVSHESIRIGFLVAALNGLDVLAADIQNAYLNAPTEEKVWFRAGPEWGPHAGKPVLIVRALYGLKSSGQAWRSHFAQTLERLGFKSSLADPDVWYKASTKATGEEYYTYLLVYVDDLLCIDENPKRYMDLIERDFKIKDGSIGPPRVYLGANCQKNPSRMGDVECWGMSAEQYCKEAVKNVKKKMRDNGYEYNKKLSDPRYSPKHPFSNMSYRPELDVTKACNDEQYAYYANLISVLRWMVELGRIDIGFEVSVLSQHMAYPRVGHLMQALHIFKYLDIHKENMLNFDPTYLDLPEPLDPNENPSEKIKAMKRFYPDAEEAIPDNAPTPCGKSIQINAFVDADHAGNKLTRRSHTGFIIFMNMAPIYWYSKRQNSVETSTYSSEMVALRIVAEKIIDLRYKLRMFGIPIDGYANVFCDNEAVYKSTSIADSTLKKKHNSVAYHKIRECTAANILVVHKEETGSNLADILTKSLSPEKRKYFIERIMTDDKVRSYATK